MGDHYYKFLSHDGRGPYSSFRWPLPTKYKPGRWVEASGKLRVCSNGIHAITGPEYLAEWIARLTSETWGRYSPRLFVAELEEVMTRRQIRTSNPYGALHPDKVVARRGRLLWEYIDWWEAWRDIRHDGFSIKALEETWPLYD